MQPFKCVTTRTNPAKPGAVTGQATYVAFVSSLMKVGQTSTDCSELFRLEERDLEYTSADPGIASMTFINPVNQIDKNFATQFLLCWCRKPHVP